MKVICVDDERVLMEDTVELCMELPEISAVNGFTKASEALNWVKDNHTDLAILDIDMPIMNGIELAMKIKNISPDTAIIFLTGYAEYAVDAFTVRASGYLLKPVTKEALIEDIKYVFSQKNKNLGDRVCIKTFGMFEVYVNGRQVKFNMTKCKEILAYLVDQQGGSVTRAHLAAALWEDRVYDRKLQKQLDVYIRSLRDTLVEYGIQDIFVMQRGTLRIVPEEFECDVYDFFAGAPSTVNSYRGEYMSTYSWASMTEGFLYWNQSSKNNIE